MLMLFLEYLYISFSLWCVVKDEELLVGPRLFIEVLNYPGK